MIKGIDVSHWDGVVDWCSAWTDGIKFMSAKATEGISVTDATCFDHINAAKAAGLLVGGYHFFHPRYSGFDQAEHFYKNVPHEIDWIALDFEAHDNRPTQEQVSEAKIFLDTTAKNFGKKPFIYLSPSFADDLGNPVWMTDYHLWIAHYAVAAPRIPAPWTTWDIWQYSENDYGSMDTNVFNGTLDELQTLFS